MNIDIGNAQRNTQHQNNRPKDRREPLEADIFFSEYSLGYRPTLYTIAYYL